jgi:hypothetical protein
VRWLAPIAAMAAVIGVVAGVSLAGRGSSELPAATSPEPAGTMPRYYVNVYQNFVEASPAHFVTLAVVHDSATGAALTTVRVPTMTGWHGATGQPSVAAAGDDRTFVITETVEKATGAARRNGVPVAFRNVTNFYLLRVAANGRSASLSPLPVSIGNLTVDDVAVSADGRKLAVAAQSCQNSGRCTFTGIRVITLATGAAADWTTQASGAAWNLSWAGDRYLAFRWQEKSGQGYRLLDVAGMGGNLLAAPAIASPALTTIVPAPTTTPAPVTGDYGFTPPALITADGRVVITTAVRHIPEGNGLDTVVASVVELSAGTGRVLKVLYTTTARDVTPPAPSTGQGCQVLSLGPTGVQPLVGCSSLTGAGSFTFGRLENGNLTALPGFLSPTGTVSGQGSIAW